MPAEVEHWISAFHREHLKPLGFRKTRHTFVRERDGYVEVFEIQGSAWNDRSRPWRFYLNVNVRFPGLNDAIPARIGQLIADAPEHFELASAEDTDLAARLADYIVAASEWIASDVPSIRTAIEHHELWFAWS